MGNQVLLFAECLSDETLPSISHDGVACFFGNGYSESRWTSWTSWVSFGSEQDEKLIRTTISASQDLSEALSTKNPLRFLES